MPDHPPQLPEEVVEAVKRALVTPYQKTAREAAINAIEAALATGKIALVEEDVPWTEADLTTEEDCERNTYTESRARELRERGERLRAAEQGVEEQPPFALPYIQARSDNEVEANWRAVEAAVNETLGRSGGER